LRSILSILSGASFIFFGLACFYSDAFINEFSRYGLADYRKMVGCFELLGGLGCIIGIFHKRILIVSSLGLSLMMLMGVAVRIKINDTLIQTLPAILYFLINMVLFSDLMIERRKQKRKSIR
jgi:hypothetical protein